jgi:hypothetical protein
MKAAAVPQHFLDSPKAALAADNPILGEELRWSWYGSKYTRKHETVGPATCACGGESLYILGVSEARPQKETQGVEHAREYRN